MKILLGEISSYKAIVIAKYLKKTYKNIEIIGYDYKKVITKVHTKYIDQCVHIPKNNLNQYIYEIAEIVRCNQVDFFIPVHSDYIGDILLNKNKFGNTLSYIGNYSDYLMLHEKDQLMKLCNKIGVRVPVVYDNIVNAKFPFVVKPTNKSSSKGVKYCFNEKDKKDLLETYKFDSYICQEYIEGEGCGYSVYCIDGKIKIGYGHIRIAEFPISGGSSVYRKSYTHPDMKKNAEIILQHIKWTGFAMFEFKLTPNNELILIEVNPRIWGSINQALTNNVPLFNEFIGDLDLLQESNGKEKTTYLNPQIYYSLLLYCLCGKFFPLKEFIKNWRKNASDVSFFYDMGGFLSIILRKLL